MIAEGPLADRHLASELATYLREVADMRDTDKQPGLRRLAFGDPLGWLGSRPHPDRRHRATQPLLLPGVREELAEDPAELRRVPVLGLSAVHPSCRRLHDHRQPFGAYPWHA